MPFSDWCGPQLYSLCDDDVALPELMVSYDWMATSGFLLMIVCRLNEDDVSLWCWWSCGFVVSVWADDHCLVTIAWIMPSFAFIYFYLIVSGLVDLLLHSYGWVHYCGWFAGVTVIVGSTTATMYFARLMFLTFWGKLLDSWIMFCRSKMNWDDKANVYCWIIPVTLG